MNYFAFVPLQSQFIRRLWFNDHLVKRCVVHRHQMKHFQLCTLQPKWRPYIIQRTGLLVSLSFALLVWCFRCLCRKKVPFIYFLVYEEKCTRISFSFWVAASSLMAPVNSFEAKFALEMESYWFSFNKSERYSITRTEKYKVVPLFSWPLDILPKFLAIEAIYRTSLTVCEWPKYECPFHLWN